MNEKRMSGVSVTDSEDEDKRKRAAKKGFAASSSSAMTMRSCQAERCSADLSVAKTYHRRHKVCEHHAKSQAVLVAGLTQRFCQQCSRFHELSEFDDTKRSCRRRLAGHNERRRKSFAEISSQIAEGSGSSRTTTKGGADTDTVCGGGQYNVQENGNYKQYQVTMR